MAEKYQFYVQMDGQVFGPYTARETKDLNLLDDILVTEESMYGQWLPSAKFDFDDMVRKESGEYIITDYIPDYTPQPEVQQTASDPEVRETPYNPRAEYAEIYKWNWGAFFFGWIWGIGNGVYWPLWMLLINILPLGGLASLAISIILGIKGSRLAWKAKRWRSLEHFERVQHVWAKVALWVFLGSVATFVVIIILLSVTHNV